MLTPQENLLLHQLYACTDPAFQFLNGAWEIYGCDISVHPFISSCLPHGAVELSEVCYVLCEGASVHSYHAC